MTVAESGEKSRVRLPAALSDRLLSRASLDSAVFLVRDGSTGVRDLTVDQAVELCRDDVETGKTDPAVLAAAEADLRALLATVPIREFSLSDDLDDCFENFKAVVRSPQTVA
jgi:hypothetical protein